MTTIGDMLGSKSDELVRYALSIGDVHILPLGEAEGITPKDGKRLFLQGLSAIFVADNFTK